MRKMVNIKSYLADEAGTLLVFFAVCCATLLGILALSFDLGRRAATQSDMQSFADNVALAAAKELDGTDDATDRAKLAAVALINAANERLKAGTASKSAIPRSRRHFTSSSANPHQTVVLYSSSKPASTTAWVPHSAR